MKGDIFMSVKNINRASVLEKLVRKEIKQKQAAQILGVTVRQMRRLVKRYQVEGASGLVHKARGRESNNKVNREKLDRAIEVIKDKYWDFGPTLAHEKLVEDHEFTVSLSRLRREMIKVGLWKPKRRKKRVIHQLRERRPCFGELIQLDGSPHDWFEGRAPKCNLNVAIDDATSTPFFEFSPSETTQGYFSLVEKYFYKYGLPISFYTDKHSVFQVNTPTKLAHKKPSNNEAFEGLTQFSRACKQLDIELIPANTPQAKGRVERINGILQDRLVKDLRLRNISTIEEANNYLPEFTGKYISRFAVSARSKVNMHRQLPKGLDLSKILSCRETRVLSKNLTFQYDGSTYQIKTKRSAYALRKMVVVIRERYDGVVTVWDNRDKMLEYTVAQKVDKIRDTSSKELNRLVDEILIQKTQLIPMTRNPWESDPSNFEEQSLYYKPKGAV